MKKGLIALSLLLALCVTGCQNVSVDQGTTDVTKDNANDVSAEEFWAGVEGDTQQFKWSLADNITVELKKDGSMSTYCLADAYHTAEDLGFGEYDAEMAVYMYTYGTYQVENGKIVMTLNDTKYMRAEIRGKDATAFKEAYLAYLKAETPSQSDDLDKLFGDGYPRGEESEDKQIITCVRVEEFLKPQVAKMVDKNGVLLSESVYADDHSHVDTEYAENGTITRVSEYDSEDTLIKRTQYDDNGNLQYVQTSATDANGMKVTARVDAQGNEIYREEYLKTQVGNVEKITRRIVENGVQVSYEENEHRENGLQIRYTMCLEGDEVVESKTVEGGIGEFEYYMYQRTLDGVVTYYTCQRYFDREDVAHIYVEYSADTGIYSLRTRDAFANQTEQEIPASEYVRGDWEIYE